MSCPARGTESLRFGGICKDAVTKAPLSTSGGNAIKHWLGTNVGGVRMKPQQVQTTHISPSESQPAASERRDGERHMTVYRVGSLSIGDQRELCLVKNISAAGMMVHTYCTIPEGTAVTVEFKCGRPIDGKVSWFREPNAGISFDEPIDVVEILSTSADGPRPRMPRIAIESVVTVREGASVFRLRTCDVSQGGMKLSCEAPIAAGSGVVVTLDGLGPNPAIVRWCGSGHIGLTFNRTLPLTSLVGWLQTQRDRILAAS